MEPGLQADTLFGEHIRNRPKMYDEATVQLAAEKCADALFRDFPDDFQADNRAQIVTELTDVFQYSHDGYERGRALDQRHGWVIDAELVEVLDGDFLRRALEDRTAAWIQAECIQPRLAVGDQVILHTERFEGDPPVPVVIDETATVTRVDMKRGEYALNVPGFGHNPPGSRLTGTTGIILDFEKVEAKTILQRKHYVK
jgi:hypothetical protein